MTIPGGEVRISSARASFDNWLLIQVAGGYNALYTRDGNLYRTLPAELNHSAQVVFSRTDPNILYFVSGIHVKKYDIAKDAIFPVTGFSQFSYLASGHAEGDISEDGWMGLVGVREDKVKAIFGYNVETGQRSNIHLMSEPFDNLKAAKDGWLLVSWKHGIQAYPLNGPSHPVAPNNGHACTGVHNGRPVLLWFSNARAVPWRNTVELIDIANPSDVRILMDFGRDNYAGHVSAGPKDAFISIFDPTAQLPSQIWQAPFDGSAPTMRHQWTGPYDPLRQPRATVSADGSLLLFNKLDGVTGLELESTPNDLQVDTPPAAQPAAFPDGLELLDYRPFNGERFRLVVDMLVVDGILTTESTKMYRRH